MTINFDNWVWLDADGTFVDFYGVDGWLNDLENFNPRPYRIAKPLYNMNELNRELLRLKNNGYKIGIVSWLSKKPNYSFDIAVTRAKRDWFHKYGILDIVDEILILPYGTCKSDICKNYCVKGILCDDEAQNREKWELGDTFDATNNLIDFLLNL